jgi:hypothetical protein
MITDSLLFKTTVATFMKWHNLIIRTREVFQVPFKPFKQSVPPASTLSIRFTRRMSIKNVNLNDSILSP